MRRLIIVIAIWAACVAAAQAQIWIMSPANQTGGHHTAAPVSGALLLEDGVSILLLEDGTSSLCLEGGC